MRKAVCMLFAVCLCQVMTLAAGLMLLFPGRPFGTEVTGPRFFLAMFALPPLASVVLVAFAVGEIDNFKPGGGT